jgi:hypothetical protein
MNKREIKRNAELAEQCYVNPSDFDYKKYAALIRADEREECAKMVDALRDEAGIAGQICFSWCAGVIRARSKA